MKKEKDIFDRIMELPVYGFLIHFTKKIKKYYYTYSLVA